MENQQAQVHANNIDVLEKKQEKKQEDAVMVDLEQPKDKNENNGVHHTLAQELQRTRSHSSTSSDEEVEEGGERKRKKKKGLVENIKDKLSGKKEGDVNNDEAALGKVEAATHEEEKKGFLEKIIEKLPGHHKTEDATKITASPDDDEHNYNTTRPEKKGILEKIKENLPGHHNNNQDNDVLTKEKLN